MSKNPSTKKEVKAVLVQDNGQESNVTKMAAALAAARPLKSVRTEDPVDLLEIPVMSNEEVERLAKAAADRREFIIKGSNEALPAIEAEIARLTGIDAWDDSALIVARVNALQDQRKKILERIGDPGRVKFAQFIAQIQTVETFAQFKMVLDRLVTESTDEAGNTRYHKASVEKARVAKVRNADKLPMGWFSVNGVTYAPFEPPEGEPKSSGQKLVESMVVKAIRKCQKEFHKKAKAYTAVLLENPHVKWELSAELKKNIAEVTAGLYGHQFAEKGKDGRNGVLLVRIARGKKELVVEPWDGSGDFIRFTDLRVAFAVPFEMARRGVIPEHFPEEHAGMARRMVSLLNEIVKL